MQESGNMNNRKVYMSQVLRVPRRFSLGIISNLGLRLKSGVDLAYVSLLVAAGLTPSRVQGAEEGVALAIIYDTSGSMKEPVPDSAGGMAPKYAIANRALRAVTRQLEAYATNSTSGTTRKIDAGLFVFQGEHAREAVGLGPLDPIAFENFADHFS